MKLSVVIPAAGQGRRMGADKNKQFLLLNGKPILAHTISKFQNCSYINEIIIVAKNQEISYCQKEIVDKYDFDKVKKLIIGGKTRQKSVYNGIKEVSADSNFVLIHDGARPLLTNQIIENIITEVVNYQAVAVGVAVKDTIKIVNQDKYIMDTPKRDNLIAIQTPQCFSKTIILDAYQKAFKENFIGTDSSSLVERLGQRVKVIEGSYENLKITTPEDLQFAERILFRR
ncbi:2-C-methyl-D-erythritol 4-phosphate cytidylyltransferase [Orenia marismortui]|uniref:2-C-methyl-D-erythritol 4-phosphate cytidylyltransferase n=1 Tax=Orenia marismortui TaxID=46469 RepID=A0A4R8GTC8_9FIRM|nr:2-C-methyl-D-erythritol 4-phosphate cytidylyltransferase [Orenia marismortui]TDX49312.1 2-C-methyl-D-erythritol 4-phosphate cytidylyltransferase [Orenia marismortui]